MRRERRSSRTARENGAGEGECPDRSRLDGSRRGLEGRLVGKGSFLLGVLLDEDRREGERVLRVPPQDRDEGVEMPRLARRPESPAGRGARLRVHATYRAKSWRPRAASTALAKEGKARSASSYMPRASMTSSAIS